MINKDELEQLFKKMRKAGWNMEQALSWGYFFKHQSKEPLQQLANEFQQQGYDILEINQSYPDNMYWLQLEKIEQHSIDSLHARNQQLHELAQQYHIHAYDGMDVSPIDIE
ncbi:ribonuclease E inhibitor RraB [sulfur-oxidizing endosymbiont of Gigantopelta aegis]|uniref:ribonuclease E inhibitor RraB n=1 Tax=sulfur-oxidizing endosymbiont of Gigantopelta aegis TaxID=2794934 RepID=UPI0018DD36D1|nr:ribonuclease E inhibitor RraB [sulfur-oxidizing endosymbiont of Gigantopelta aegis]